MADIERAKERSANFLKMTLGVEDVRVIKVARVDEGWEAEAEVYEEDSFIKSLGLPTRVRERNRYSVRLDDKWEVISYERTAHH